MERRIFMDLSSVMWRCLSVGKDAENGMVVIKDGKEVQVNSKWYGYDNAMNSTCMVLENLRMTPSNLLIVRESGPTKERRRQIYPGYKFRKSERPDELVENFNAANDMLVAALGSVGAQVVTQYGVEADDVIAYLCGKFNGEKVIFSEDGDLSQLINDETYMWKGKTALTENPFGDFPIQYIALYKALVGDTSDTYPGAKGFGEAAWVKFCEQYPTALGALEGMIKRNTLGELEEDVPNFKPFQNVIDNSEMVRACYELARLRPEWVDTDQQPLVWTPGSMSTVVEDHRLRRYAGAKDLQNVISWEASTRPAPEPEVVPRKRMAFDIELIGTESPVFLVRARALDGEAHTFWYHRPGDMEKMEKLFRRTDVTFVSFNGMHFDEPIISAAINGGLNPVQLKNLAHELIEGGLKPWHAADKFNYKSVGFDHIDLFHTAPGIQINLKTYEGRMGMKDMMDMPVHHLTDLAEDQLPMVEVYCDNDTGATLELMSRLDTEITLREEMGREYGLDLRSKSDAQIAEAVLRKQCGITRAPEIHVPRFVNYTPPSFIETDSDVINGVITEIRRTSFMINRANGQVQAPDFLSEPIKLGYGTYQMGVGGLHSTHDTKLFVEADEEFEISDFDVASYYPNIMMKAGLVPKLEGGKGEIFMAEYGKIYDRRMEAKRAKLKKIANALKIVLNGTFGKLGSMFSAFYAPDLMLGVTMTGQLNLMCLIHELEQTPDVTVLSANTDGVMVRFPRGRREAILNTILENAERTGFEYEETPYARIAMKDVNNYFAVTCPTEAAVIKPDGTIYRGTGEDNKVKRKGLYASIRPEDNPLYLMKNPTMNVCSEMATEWLRSEALPHQTIGKYTDIRDFVSIRAVKGGGIQYDAEVEVDDWVCVKDVGTKDNEWRRPGWPESKASTKRKSRPAPVLEGRGGRPFGRIARWYMTTDDLPPISYAGSGNRVPKTEGAKVCMTLPDALPVDLDKAWYVEEACRILTDCGVPAERLIDEKKN